VFQEIVPCRFVSTLARDAYPNPWGGEEFQIMESRTYFPRGVLVSSEGWENPCSEKVPVDSVAVALRLMSYSAPGEGSAYLAPASFRTRSAPALWFAGGRDEIAGNLAAQSLRESLKDIPVADHWIYDDLPAAIAQAKESGKPLLVVLRCVPCPPGRALDEQVMQPAGDLAELEKQFVCVRVIQTNGLDLDLFQYDYDMSWACMFLNADLTV
jgi:hypothetical protein